MPFRELHSAPLQRLLILLSVVIAAPLASEVQAGDTLMLSIDATGGAPLATVARVLERRHGMAITYEDPVFADPADLAPAAPALAGSSAGTLRQGVRSANVKLSYAVSPATGRPEDLAAIVRQAIGLHEGQGNPGRFRVERDGAVLHIIPAQVKDASGQWRDATPVLDTELDFPAADRNLEDTITLILQQVSQVSGVRVVSVQEPINVERRIPLRLGAARARARDLLTQAIGSLPKPSSWSLRYMPGGKRLALEIHSVSSRQ